MSMIDAYCVDRITIVKWNGNDSWGEPESGTLVDIKGHVVWKTQLVRNQRGEEIASTVMVYLPKRKVENLLGRPLLHEDRIILGAAGAIYDVGIYDEVYYDIVTLNERAIVNIHMPKAFSGPHYEIYLA